MTFAELGAHPSLDRALKARGYATPTPVQVAVLAPDHLGRDLLVSSQTGSGKTVAFGLALAPTLLGERAEASPPRKPRVLVITPTRELAQQVSRELAWLYASARVSVATCVGGMDPRAEARILAHGVHVVVGTPGRLVDHLQRKQLPLADLEAVVLDEADEMLDMGFREELETLLKETPADRRTILFSATLPKDIVDLASRYQRNAVRIAATPPSGAHVDIEYVAHLIAQREREHALVNTLRVRQESQALCFCETRHAVAHLHANLLERGFSAVALSGELTQPERTRALTALRDGRARVLVATDVAARGLDLPDLGLVIHVDLPKDAQVLQHRSGRTGRAGRKGVAVFLVPFSRKSFAERMLGRAHIRPTWAPVPTADAVRAMDQERLFQELQAEVELSEEDLQVARRLLATRTPEQLAAALVRSQRGAHPAPEELPETTALIAREKAPKAPRPRAATTPARFPSSLPPRSGPVALPRPPAAPPRPGSPQPSNPARPGEASEAMAWFRLNLGRDKNADPRWLVPLLCRRGGITKAEIGKIQVFAEETRVAIAARAAERFAALARRPDPQDRAVRIEPLRERGGGAPSEAEAAVGRGPYLLGWAMKNCIAASPQGKAPEAAHPN